MAIEISRALPSEYAVILNTLPKEWFVPEPYLLYLQVADMVNANRFLIAHDGETLVGTIGWQDNVAFGAYYEKFLFVKPEYRKEGVAAMLWRELLAIAADSGQRAIFCDVPEKSPLIRSIHQVPGAREVGSIEDFHGDGVKSIIFALDVKGSKAFTTYVDRLIESSGNHRHA
ncbi:MAG: GNAT family N-acetyltransferase [Thermomicrobiales bacterium]